MKRGFLNSGKAKAKLTKDTDRIAAPRREPEILKRSYGVVENAGRPEGYETMQTTTKELDAMSLLEDFNNDTLVYTTQPSIFMNTTLASFPDGWSECLLYADAKALILSTPGFPAPLARPSSCGYRLAPSPGKGLGLYSTRKMHVGELILSERPLTVTPAAMKTTMRFLREFTAEEKFQAQLYEWEQNMKALFDRLDPEYKTAFMALANSHQHDGSGPISGIVRTNSIGLHSLQTGGYSDEQARLRKGIYCAVCKEISRLNHSCSPNTVASFDLPSFSYRLYAVREIGKGEELTFTYTPLSSEAKDRQSALEPYGFQCSCEACRTPHESDPRRALCLTMRVDTIDDGLAKLAAFEEEGLQAVEEYSEVLNSIMELYIAVGDSENASKYAQKLVNRPWDSDLWPDDAPHYTIPLGIQSHPLWMKEAAASI